MQNPWAKLSPFPPFILPQDSSAVARITQKVGVNLKSIPEPFIGNPHTAKVVLLNLNPGEDVRDADVHQRADLKQAIMLNLRHELLDYPFYPLSPAFEGTPVGQWWWQCLHALFDEGNLQRQRVANQLCVIEWFPYHSKVAKKLPKHPCCESQQYSFELARSALDNHKLVTGIRAKPRWTHVDRCFASVAYLNSWQNCAISRGNAKNFDEIVRALQ